MLPILDTGNSDEDVLSLPEMFTVHRVGITFTLTIHESSNTIVLDLHDNDCETVKGIHFSWMLPILDTGNSDEDVLSLPEMFTVHRVGITFTLTIHESSNTIVLDLHDNDCETVKGIHFSWMLPILVTGNSDEDVLSLPEMFTVHRVGITFTLTISESSNTMLLDLHDKDCETVEGIHFSWLLPILDTGNSDEDVLSLPEMFTVHRVGITFTLTIHESSNRIVLDLHDNDCETVKGIHFSWMLPILDTGNSDEDVLSLPEMFTVHRVGITFTLTIHESPNTMLLNLHNNDCETVEGIHFSWLLPILDTENLDEYVLSLPGMFTVHRVGINFTFTIHESPNTMLLDLHDNDCETVEGIHFSWLLLILDTENSDEYVLSLPGMFTVHSVGINFTFTIPESSNTMLLDLHDNDCETLTIDTVSSVPGDICSVAIAVSGGKSEKLSAVKYRGASTSSWHQIPTLSFCYLTRLYRNVCAGNNKALVA
ncbi:hypothetical protein J6590_073700 [Homalodisca vitripennis]|nr:hypothetical protein J6590_073700 [Homalodisca vitripennis]